MLSWGPPHTPFQTAPEEFKQIYREKDLTIRPNVPDSLKEATRKHLIGYYGHMTALDKCLGELQEAIKAAGLEENTLFVFTSDHGYMINSQGWFHKQVPYEESAHVPFLIKYPAKFGRNARSVGMLMNTPDIMPTLLGICNLPIPGSVEGDNLSGILTGERKDDTEAVLLACYHPFGQWPRRSGGNEYRGVRTRQYTYACNLNGPWLLFDNSNDPYQLNNLVDNEDFRNIRESLHTKMLELLVKTNDSFETGMRYIEKWGYVVDETETIPYVKINYKGMPIQN